VTAGNATWCQEHKQQSQGCQVVLHDPNSNTFRPCPHPKRPGTTSCCAHSDLNRHPPNFETRGDKPTVRRDKPYTPAAVAAAGGAGSPAGLMTPSQQGSRVQRGDYRPGNCWGSGLAVAAPETVLQLYCRTTHQNSAGVLMSTFSCLLSVQHPCRCSQAQTPRSVSHTLHTPQPVLPCSQLDTAIPTGAVTSSTLHTAAAAAAVHPCCRLGTRHRSDSSSSSGGGGRGRDSLNACRSS
jgi:hypothetical protein